MAQDSRLGSDPLQRFQGRSLARPANGGGELLPEPRNVPRGECENGAPAARDRYDQTLDYFLSSPSEPSEVSRKCTWNPNLILRNLPMALCVCDVEGRLAYANPAFEHLSGYGGGDWPALALDDDSLFYGQSQTCPHNVTERLVSTGAPQRCLIELRHRDGTLILVEAEYHLGGAVGAEAKKHGDTFFYVFLQEACASEESLPASPVDGEAAVSGPGHRLDPTLQAALDAAICLCGHAAEKEADELDGPLREAFYAIVGQAQELFLRESGNGSWAAQCFEHVVHCACLEHKVPPDVLDFSCSGDTCNGGEVRRNEIILLSYVVYALLDHSLGKGKKLTSCRLEAALNHNGCQAEAGQGGLSLNLTGDEIFFARKLKLHDKKKGPLQRIVRRIVKDKGSILFIRRDKGTDVKISLTGEDSKGGHHEQEKSQD